MSLNSLKIGDVLVREKGGVYSKHFAIVFNSNGNVILAENQSGFGVRLISLEQFLSEGDLVRIEKNDLSHERQVQTRNRINEKLGLPYSLLLYNCESFVNDVLFGKPASEQVRNIIVLGIFLIIAFATFKFSNPNSNKQLCRI